MTAKHDHAKHEHAKPDPGPEPGREAEDVADKPAGASPTFPTATVSKPGKRPIAEIQRDLDAARAKLHEMHPLVEGDQRRIQNQANRIADAQAKWKVEHPDEPFDPDYFSPPMRPYEGGADLQKQFHKQHYVVAELEKELAAANPAL